MRGLDDATREKDGAMEERFDIRWLDSVLLALAPVAGVPVELPGSSCYSGQPVVQAAVWRELTSYSVASGVGRSQMD